MTIRNLDKLLQPSSIAVIGASNHPSSVGSTVMRNLLAGGFDGAIMPVNPNHKAVAGVLAYPDVKDLPIAPDLAVMCTPAPSVPGLIGDLGERGTRAAVVLSAGLREAVDGSGESLTLAMLKAARPHMLRIVGPNCLGILSSVRGLNASFAPRVNGKGGAMTKGNIAFVAQSGAVASAVLDWSGQRGIGFSHFLSIGDAADVDAGDLLDYLGSDANTRSILLYLEQITSARKFMSAARAAARNKPVIVVKAGREAEGAAAAASHTGALAGADEVYDAAIRRAGMLRVTTIQDLFNAAETLGRGRPKPGDPLTIITNGGGAGVMATDALAARGGKLRALTEATLDQLDAVLPATWSGRNPIDIIGDAPVERYVAALRAVLSDASPQTVLLIYAPTAIVDSADIARAVVPMIGAAPHTVLTCWMGGAAVAQAREICASGGVPAFDTPEAAVAAHLQMATFRHNQDALMETPASIPETFTVNRTAAQVIIDEAVAAGREQLSEPEAKAILSAYGLPVVETRIARDSAHARTLARDLGFPVALKVLSPEITHKSDVGGVVLDLENEAAVVAAAEAIEQRMKALRPEAHLTGFTIQRMARRPGAFELIVGAREDPVFGPVILFGEGGTAVEIIADRAVGLPPLNMALASNLMQRTRIHNLLKGYRDRPGADRDAIASSLIKVAHLVTDLPEVIDLDINPLIADGAGVLVLDARIRVRQAEGTGPERLSIRPYPTELEETVVLGARQILLRPIRPEDEPQHYEFLSRLSPEDIRFRFFSSVRSLPHSQMARFTQIDFEREMAFIATAPGDGGNPETLGVVRVVTDPDNEKAEFAIIVRSDLKGQGLGAALLDKMIAYCRGRGTRELVGQVMAQNRAMLGLAESRGFSRQPSDSPDTVDVCLSLDG
jgi:acetyltransferase